MYGSEQRVLLENGGMAYLWEWYFYCRRGGPVHLGPLSLAARWAY